MVNYKVASRCCGNVKTATYRNDNHVDPENFRSTQLKESRNQFGHIIKSIFAQVKARFMAK